MDKITYDFHGLMAPVFTAFSDDAREVLYDGISDYGKFLKANNVHGVLVNGTSGEGMCLSVAERMKTAEHWKAACVESQLSFMLQIGGTAIADVHSLATHAARIDVDAILCLPDLYFKPKTEEALVRYFQGIAEHCPNVPLLYYHIPSFTGVNLNLPRFLDLAEAAIPNFVGLKYTSGDLEIGAACLRRGRSVFLGADTILSAAYALGFDSAIMTTLNICPEHSLRIGTAVRGGQLAAAAESQRELTHRVQQILLATGDWVADMKAEFNRVHGLLDCGPVRKPI